MFRLLKYILVLILAAMPGVARAQYYPRPVYPAYPVNPYAYPGYGPGYGYGSALSGAADVTRANGDLAVSYEQARIMREQVNQAKIETKKKAFDQMLYEKANTPSYTEQLTKEKALILRRMMDFPSSSEIVNGVTLNTMMPMLQAFSAEGTQGPPVALPKPSVLALNVSTNGTSSVGILRNGGHIDWPPVLRGPQQKKLDKLLPAAYEATLAGSLDAKLLKQIRAEVQAIRDTLRTQIQKEEIDTTSYMLGLEFHRFLAFTIDALERPDARKQLDGTFYPRGRNVQELIDFMTDTGLKFAPATPGGGNEYKVVHDAAVRYARAAQASAGYPAAGISKR